MSGGIVSWSAEDVKNHIEFQHRFDRELTESGEMVFNEGLTFLDQARVVRADEKGAPVVTDGPFPDACEVEDLLRELAPRVLGTVARKYRDVDAAEDAVQEALLAAATQWPTSRGWPVCSPSCCSPTPAGTPARVRTAS